MSFAVRCVAIFILLTFRKVRDILRQWYEDKLALEVSTPRFDLDFRCPSEDTVSRAQTNRTYADVTIIL